MAKFQISIDRDMTICLIPNKLHEKGDNKPCLKGAVKINGVAYDIAVWAPKPGKKMYSGTVTPREEEDQQQQQQPQPPNDPAWPADQGGGFNDVEKPEPPAW